MLWRTMVLVRRAEEAEARGRLRVAEAAEATARVEVSRLGEAARAAAARLAAAREIPAPGGSGRRASDLQQDERWRARLREEHARTIDERAAAERRLLAARASHESARGAVADAVKRRQGAESEARRRRADAIRTRERREEAAAADAQLAIRPRR